MEYQQDPKRIIPVEAPAPFSELLGPEHYLRKFVAATLESVFTEDLRSWPPIPVVEHLTRLILDNVDRVRPLPEPLLESGRLIGTQHLAPLLNALPVPAHERLPFFSAVGDSALYLLGKMGEKPQLSKKHPFITPERMKILNRGAYQQCLGLPITTEQRETYIELGLKTNRYTYVIGTVLMAIGRPLDKDDPGVGRLCI